MSVDAVTIARVIILSGFVIVETELNDWRQPPSTNRRRRRTQKKHGSNDAITTDVSISFVFYSKVVRGIETLLRLLSRRDFRRSGQA